MLLRKCVCLLQIVYAYICFFWGGGGLLPRLQGFTLDPGPDWDFLSPRPPVLTAKLLKLC